METKIGFPGLENRSMGESHGSLDFPETRIFVPFILSCSVTGRQLYVGHLFFLIHLNTFFIHLLFLLENGHKFWSWKSHEILI